MNLYFTESIYFIFFILRMHSWMRWQTFFLYKDLHEFHNAALAQKYKRQDRSIFFCLHQIPKNMEGDLTDTLSTFNHNDEYPQIYPSPPESSLFKSSFIDFDEIIALRQIVEPIDLLGGVLHLFNLPPPKYTLQEAGHGRYLCEVSLASKLVFQSFGYNDAAEKALDFILRCPSAFYEEECARTYKKLPLIPSMRPDGSYISALKELCQSNGFDNPIYEYNDPLFEDEWECRIFITTSTGIHKLEFGGSFLSKHDAKKDAARVMFLGLVESL